MQNGLKMQKTLINLYGLPEEVFDNTLEILEEFFEDEDLQKKYPLFCIEPLTTEHYAPWSTMRAKFSGTLKEYEPLWRDDELNVDSFALKISQQGVYPAWHYAIELANEKGARIMVGCLTIGLPRGGTEKAVRISYWIAEPFQKQGIGTKAVGRLVELISMTDTYRRIEALVCPENVPSQRILEKNGFEREGLLKEPLKINDVWRDHYLYALITKTVDMAYVNVENDFEN